MTDPSSSAARPAHDRAVQSWRSRLAAVAVAATAVGLAPAVATAAAEPVPAVRAAAVRATAGASQPQAPAAAAGPAQWGAGWLAAQISAHGGHLVFSGKADPSDTAYAVIGLQAAGVGRTASRQAIAYLKTQLTTAVRYADGSDNPGRLAYYILAAVGAGQNPYRFGGRGARNNLVARLLATQRTTGADAGLFGSADPTYDGAFRSGTALVALNAAKVRPTRPAVVRAVHWLARQQCADGLWLGHRADTAKACPAANAATFAGPDTNNTSMAVQGLAAFGRHPHQARTLRALRRAQSADGGFPSVAAPGQASDPDSTALTIQTLLADHAGPSGRAWQKRGRSPYGALRSYQLGCGDPAAGRGAYFFPGARTANVLATVQSVPAAAGQTLLVHPRPLSDAVPHPVCTAAAG